MNSNQIIVSGFSNPESERLYRLDWEGNAALKQQHELGLQCGGCSFFARFGSDWGLCCNSLSSHFLETTFEHFTCLDFVKEGWGPHSFTIQADTHCKCEGGSLPEALSDVLAQIKSSQDVGLKNSAADVVDGFLSGLNEDLPEKE